MLKQICIFLLYCPVFSNQRCTLLSTVNDIDSSLTNTILIYFSDKFDIYSMLDISENTVILNATMNYVISTNRFEESLF